MEMLVNQILSASNGDRGRPRSSELALTAGRRRQIEDEERHRLAEEQYRARIRAEIGQVDAPAMTACPPNRDRGMENGRSRVGLLLAILSVVVIIATYIGIRSANASNSQPASAPNVRYVPITDSIASGQVTVPASGYVQYRFQIAPEMRNARVSGRLSGSLPLAAIIVNETEYTNWINGHPAKAFYSSQGKKTIDSFDVSLPTGTYYFAIGNQFSVFSMKYVFLQVELKYSRMETY